MIVGKRILFGYATIIYSFKIYALHLRSAPLHEYKIGELAKNEKYKIPEIIIKMKFNDYFKLREFLNGATDIFKFKKYKFDFSKAGGKLSKKTVSKSLDSYMSQMIYPCLAC